jgi:aminoglycoside phosphotransferase (APT) family kinase protein
LLPVLAPHLPVEVPVPHAVGEPGEGCPFHWHLATWLDRTNPLAPSRAPGAPSGRLSTTGSSTAGDGGR